jgi:hypothetical protein
LVIDAGNSFSISPSERLKLASLMLDSLSGEGL